MSIFKTGAAYDQVTSGSYVLVPFLFLGLYNDPLYVWGGIGAYSGGNPTGDSAHNAATWQGVGNLGSISNIKDDVKGGSNSLKLTFSGLDTSLVSEAKNLGYQGQRATLWIGVFNSEMELQGGQVFSVFSGEISNMTLIAEPKNNRIEVEIVHRAALLKRSLPRFRTDEDQQTRFAGGAFNGDKFFDQVYAIMNKTVYWGMEHSPGRITGGSGGGGPRGGWPGDFNIH